jgi:hypothetical protein
MEPKFNAGQRVRFITIRGSHPAIDREINLLAGNKGAVIRSYSISMDEMPDRIKMVKYPGVVYSYDIRLDKSGDTVRGIPEAALEAE